MNGGGDVFTSLTWGLGKYWWLVLLCVVGLGVAVPVQQSRAADVYEARAQVGPIGELSLRNYDPLPRLGDTVFNNGAVADAVREELDLPRAVSVVPSRVELIAAQDNLVFTVVGRGPTAESARDLANLAASTFSLELNRYSASVGEFAIQRSADLPTDPVPTLFTGYVALGVGVLAGAVVGIGLLLLVLVLRRPVVDPDGAEQATGWPVLGQVRLPRHGLADAGEDVLGIGLLCRGILAAGPDVVQIAAPPGQSIHAHQLATAVPVLTARLLSSAGPTSAASRPGHSHLMPTGDAEPATARPPQVVVLDAPSLDQWLAAPGVTLTLLVVSKGTGLRKLRESAASFTGGLTGIVLVTPKRRLGLPRSRRPRVSPSPRSGRVHSVDDEHDDPTWVAARSE